MGEQLLTTQAAAISGNVIADDSGQGVDSDPAGAADLLTVSSHTGPANGTLVLAADGSFTYTPGTTFSGTDSFTYTIADGDGGFSTGTVAITVGAAASGSILTVSDSCLGGTALLVNGTSAGDTIVVTPGSDSTLQVPINGVTTTHATPTGRVIVLGGDGDDNIQIAGAVTNLVWLYGDAGNDRLNAGSGGSLIFGGDGNDQMNGGSGRNVMIGGQGLDQLIGNSSDDILVAGFTDKDSRSSPDHEEFWCDVIEEWNSSNALLARVQNLRNGTGGNSHNRSSFLVDHVFDDWLFELDQLNGSSGHDWFLWQAGEDKVSGQIEAEA